VLDASDGNFQHVTFPPLLVTAKVAKAAVRQIFALLLRFAKSDNETPLELYSESGRIVAFGDDYFGVAAFFDVPQIPLYFVSKATGIVSVF
jgi:hypothetical protein